MSKKKWLIVLGVLVLVLGAGFVPVGEVSVEAGEPVSRSETMDLSRWSDAAPSARLKMLFIHHSIGGQWLADPGDEVSAGGRSLYRAHKNGGGLRARLEQDGYSVAEATYGSEVGERTDLFDWLPKFRDGMDRILRTERQDGTYGNGERNRIVMFKSCYPNSKFTGAGNGSGSARGPELTVANAEATMRELRDVLQQHPDVLFVYVTAPPHAPRIRPEPAWKWVARRVLGRVFDPAESGRHARAFNNWMRSPDGWLRGYRGNNIVVFDYYDVLTGEGAMNVSRYPTGGGFDSHPSSDGNRRATEAFVPFLNRAVRRAGLSE